MSVELTDSEKEQVTWLEKEHFTDFFKLLSNQFIQEIDQKITELLLTNRMYTPSMIKQKVTIARQEILKKAQSSLIEEDFLKGLALIIDHCKENSAIYLLDEWQSIPSGIQKLGETEKKPFAESFQEAIGISNEAMGAAYQASVKYYDLKDYTKALCIISCINMFNSLFFNCWFLQALCYQALNQWSKAIYSHSICVILKPSEATPKYYLAYCHFQNNEQALAKDFLAIAQTQASQQDTQPDFVPELMHSLHVNQ